MLRWAVTEAIQRQPAGTAAAAGQGRHHRPPRQGGQEHRQDRRRPRAAHPGLLRHARRAHPPRSPAAAARPHDRPPARRAAASYSAPRHRARGRRTFCPLPGRGTPARPGGAGARLIGPARPDANPPHAPRQHITPGTNEGMNAASGLPGRTPAVGRRQPHTRKPCRGAAFPRRPRLSARGHPRQGRLRRRRRRPGSARSLTQATRSHEHGTCTEKGRATGPVQHALQTPPRPRNRRPKPRLTPARSFRDE